MVVSGVDHLGDRGAGGGEEGGKGQGRKGVPVQPGEAAEHFLQEAGIGIGYETVCIWIRGGLEGKRGAEGGEQGVQTCHVWEI